jgi:Fe2+ or Zn2+ uptake regulation protein
MRKSKPDNEVERATGPQEGPGHVRHSLEDAGCRYTRQRAAVYEYLHAACDHPTTDEIYQAVRQRMPSISLATVYNALDALVAAGLATRLTYGDGPARYDCRGEEHYHLRDLRTDEVRDLPTRFDPELLTKLDPSLATRLAEQGFRVTGYRLEVLGHFERPAETA